MKTTKPRAWVIVGCVMLLSTGGVGGQDWPQWRGANRDNKLSGFKEPAAWPKALTEKWKVTVGQGLATPALVGDRLHVFARQGDQEVISCLDAGSGKSLWQDKYEATAVS